VDAHSQEQVTASTETDRKLSPMSRTPGVVLRLLSLSFKTPGVVRRHLLRSLSPLTPGRLLLHNPSLPSNQRPNHHSFLLLLLIDQTQLEVDRHLEAGIAEIPLA